MNISWSTRQTPKKIWKGIKELLCLKSQGSNLPSKLIINEHEINVDKGTADQLLNKFFSESGISQTTWPQLHQNEICHLIIILLFRQTMSL